MLWIKNHQPLSLLLFSVVAFFLFFLLGPSLSCSAASQSYEFTTNPGRNYVYWDFSNNTLGFIPTYYKVENLTTGTCSNTTYYGVVSVVYNNGNFSDSASFWINPDCSFLGIGSIMSNASQLMFMSYSFPTGFRLTLYDYDPSLGEPCPDCPEVPDTPYGDKLDKIYNAIMIGSATLLVIYFFFAIYSMFFGGLKR